MGFSAEQNKVIAISISRWSWSGAPALRSPRYYETRHGTLGSTVCCLHTFQISKTERDLGNIRLIGWCRLQLAGAESEVQKLNKEENNLNAWEEKEKWKNEELAWDRLLFVLCAKLLRHACRQVLTYSKNPRIRTSIFLKLHSICSYITGVYCEITSVLYQVLNLLLPCTHGCGFYIESFTVKYCGPIPLPVIWLDFVVFFVSYVMHSITFERNSIFWKQAPVLRF